MFKGLEIIASDLYIHEVVDRVVKITTQMLECERVNLFLADADRQELQVASTAREGCRARDDVVFHLKFHLQVFKRRVHGVVQPA